MLNNNSQDNKSNNLRILYFNINSYNEFHKQNLIISINTEYGISNHYPHIICLQECRIKYTGDQLDEFLSLPNYNHLYFPSRSSSNSGGLLFYILNSIQYKH